MDSLGQGTQIAGRYQLIDPVPSDVSGVEVWSASDRVLDRDVQVHLLRQGRTASALDAARRAALIQDERLIRVIDAGDHEAVPYVITARPEGQSLFELVSHHQFLPVDQARAIIGEAAEAIEAARRRGVYHLVLRPTSILRTSKGKVLVTGLGLEGALLGLDTAPSLVTARTDAMALVANLYFALTGRWPGTLPPGVAIPELEQAPVVAGSPAPPAELSAGVPNDLDTLCAVTFGPNNDGPHSASELARELAPWPEITEVDPLIMADEKPAPDPTPPPPPPAPTTPIRESIRARSAQPEPAQPARTSIGVRRTTPAPFAQGAARQTPAVFPAPVAASAGTFGAAAARKPVKKQPFNPTPWVLLLVAATVIVAIVLAFNTITAPLKPRDPSASPSPFPVETTDPETSTPTPDKSEDPKDDDKEDEERNKPIYIDTVEEVDPDGDGQHPEQQHQSYDGDPDTYWSSQWYVDASLPGRSGLGLAVTLEETSEVSAVELLIDGEGGHIEIRNADSADPGGGDLLAEGPADDTTVFEFDTVELDTFVVWITELPVDSEGNNRIRIAEITVK